MVARIERSERAGAVRPTTTCCERAPQLNDHYLGGLAEPASVRWVTTRTPAGARAPRATGRSGSPSGCRGCRRGSSTTCSCTSWPTCSSPATTRRSGRWVDRYPQAEKAKGYLLGWSAAARVDAAAAATRSTERLLNHRHDVPAGRARTMLGLQAGGQRVDRPPAHVERLLADRVRGAVGGATATKRTSRWWTPPRGSQNGDRVLVEVHRHRGRARGPRRPDSSRPRAARRRPGSGRRARSGRRTGTSGAPWRAG